MTHMTLQAVRQLIANDSYAISFQSLGQYRTALLRHVDSLTELPTPYHELSDLEVLVREYGNTPLLGDGRTRKTVMADIHSMFSRRAQPDGEAPRAEPVAWRFREYDDREKCHSRTWCITMDRGAMEIYERYGAVIEPLYAAPAAQQAAVPGALTGSKLVPLEPTPEMQQAGFDTPGAHMYNASYRAMVAVAPSAPGTPEAPALLMQALTTGIPLQEPVYIAKALRAQREARVSLAGGTGPSAAVFLVNIQMTPWTYTAATAEAYAEGYNRATKDYRAALLDVAAQLDGGQGEGKMS